MKRYKKIYLSIYFHIGVKIIGLPEIHKHSICERQYNDLAAEGSKFHN